MRAGQRLKTLWRCLFVLWQCTWGAPQTLAGLCVYLWGRAKGWPRQRYNGAAASAWGGTAGLSLGLFVFVPGFGDARLLTHEYGHCLQSLVLGPLYLPVIALPSAVWFHLPALRRLRQKKGIAYYAFYSERWADKWAAWAMKMA